MENPLKTPILPLSAPSSRSTARPGLFQESYRRLPEGIQRDAGRVFFSIWQNSNEGMRLTDENGTMIAVNQSFCRLVGMSEDALVGKHFTVIYAPEEDLNQLARSYEIKFKSGNIRTRYEKSYRLWSKKSLEVEVVTSFVEAEEGRPLMLAQFRDISAQQLMQKALVDSESKYRRLFANSVQPMFESTVDGRIVNCNRALLRLLGYENMLELAERDVARDIYVHAEDRQTVIEAIKLRGYLTNAEIQLRRKNGKIITVIEHSRAVVDREGTVIGFEGILEDITARKAMEHKLQQYLQALEDARKALGDLNAEKDKLFSILSHDLRSPFSSILGFTDMLLKDESDITPEERREFLRYIKDAATDQLALVDKLLDWSRLETGRIRMEIEDVDIAHVIGGSIASVAGLARQRFVQLSSDVPKDLHVRGDEQLILQVFTNLLGNAVKFTPDHGTIKISFLGERDHQWIIAIRDSGVGIPANDLPKLFRVEEKYTRKGLHGEKGTGLGLPVVYEIMQKHNGAIRVESEVGKGTTFTLEFPNSRPSQGRTILIADDDEGVRVLHTRYIRKLLPDVAVLQTARGTEALELARIHRPIAVLTDYDMPEMDGFELIKQIRTDTATRGIPVIVITGQDSHSNHEALILSGANEILLKPMTQDRFAETLKKLSLI